MTLTNILQLWSFWYFCVHVGVTLVVIGTRGRGGGKDVISKSQAGQHHPAWPPVSEEGEKVSSPN